MVTLDVAVSRAVPAEVALHALHHELLPCRLVETEYAAGLADHVQHVVRIVACEAEAIARACVVDEGMDGVLEAAGLANDRNIAVAQRDHLRQTARLELGRHQEHIRARIDAVGQIAREHDGCGDLVRPAALCLDEHLLILPIAGAEHDKAYIVRKDVRQNGFHEVEALLVDEAGDDADDRRVRVALQTAELQQLGLVDELAEVSKIPVPASLAALKDKEVRFTKVIDKADMKDYIYSALGI